MKIRVLILCILASIGYGYGFIQAMETGAYGLLLGITVPYLALVYVGYKVYTLKPMENTKTKQDDKLDK